MGLWMVNADMSAAVLSKHTVRMLFALATPPKHSGVNSNQLFPCAFWGGRIVRQSVSPLQRLSWAQSPCASIVGSES